MNMYENNSTNIQFYSEEFCDHCLKEKAGNKEKKAKMKRKGKWVGRRRKSERKMVEK